MEHQEQLMVTFEKQPDATLEEYCELLVDAIGSMGKPKYNVSILPKAKFTPQTKRYAPAKPKANAPNSSVRSTGH
jgi:transposase